MSLNVYSATGRIGKDCETKQVGDSVVTSFPMAIDVGFGDRKHSFWIRVNYWGKRGEAVAPWLVKGQLVAVSGELDNREYTKSDGSKGWSLELRASDVQLIGGKKREEEDPPLKVEGFEDDPIPF